jgi:hypothetical protein
MAPSEGRREIGVGSLQSAPFTIRTKVKSRTVKSRFSA